MHIKNLNKHLKVNMEISIWFSWIYYAKIKYAKTRMMTSDPKNPNVYVYIMQPKSKY